MLASACGRVARAAAAWIVHRLLTCADVRRRFVSLACRAGGQHQRRPGSHQLQRRVHAPAPGSHQGAPTRLGSPSTTPAGTRRPAVSVDSSATTITMSLRIRRRRREACRSCGCCCGRTQSLQSWRPSRVGSGGEGGGRSHASDPCDPGSGPISRVLFVCHQHGCHRVTPDVVSCAQGRSFRSLSSLAALRAGLDPSPDPRTLKDKYRKTPQDAAQDMRRQVDGGGRSDDECMAAAAAPAGAEQQQAAAASTRVVCTRSPRVLLIMSRRKDVAAALDPALSLDAALKATASAGTASSGERRGHAAGAARETSPVEVCGDVWTRMFALQHQEGSLPFPVAR